MKGATAVVDSLFDFTLRCHVCVQVCVDIFQERGHQADVKNNLSVEQLQGIVGNYDGMVIRSATKVSNRVTRCLLVWWNHPNNHVPVVQADAL